MKFDLLSESLTSYLNKTTGLVFRYPALPNDSCVAHAPFALFPNPFPKRLYQECLDIHPIVSSLMFKIANDNKFIEESLDAVIKVDDFTKKLLDINKKVQLEGLAQPTISCINRADYMLDRYSDNGRDSIRLRQVEVNAIASAMSWQSSITTKMHNFLLAKYRVNLMNEQYTSRPKNESLDIIAEGLVDAFNAYGKPNSSILLVAENGSSSNFSDHFAIEQAVFMKRPDIVFVRKKFCNLRNDTKLGSNKELLINGTVEIAVVYFRFGYDPSNYNFDGAWETRLILERSKAIKCPSINFHLSGAKKFQQILNDQEQLERFLGSADAKRLSEVFCKFWSIESDTAKGREGFNVGLLSDTNLVLKPQREGGGNNIYDKDIKTFLNSIANSEERSQYILMEFINSPKEKNWLLSYLDDVGTDSIKQDSHDELVSELGIYGSILGENNIIKANRHGGYLVRTKRYGVKEGGVASGHAGLSSLVLIDDEIDNFDLYPYYVE